MRCVYKVNHQAGVRGFVAADDYLVENLHPTKDKVRQHKLSIISKKTSYNK